jgi:formyl-CoA transferase
MSRKFVSKLFANVINHGRTFPRCVTMDARVHNREYVNSLVQEWVRQNPAQEVVQRLDDAEVAVGRINDVKDLLENEHIRARENIIEITHPKMGKVKIPGIFPRLSASPGIVRTCPDALGEHNEEVYGKLLGFTPSEIANLRKGGII